MSRLGRGQPVQPFASHGFLGNTPANGVLPGRILVVEPDDRRRKTPPLHPVIQSGASKPVTAVIWPPLPELIENVDDRKRRTPPPPPQTAHGFHLVTPPPPEVAEPEDRRRRRVTPDPLSLSGVLGGITPPAAVQPPLPVVVPLSERRKNVGGGGEISVGYPFDEGAGVVPPGPYVVPIEERRWILDRLRQPSSSHGFLGNTPPNGVLPPRGQNHDRADQRTRYLPQPSIVAGSGLLATAVPEAPVTVNAGTDWAAEVASWN